MKEPIKKDIFRFATLRSPQLISTEMKEVGFVYHPNQKASFFLKKINPNNINKAQEILLNTADTFSGFNKYQDVVDIDKKVYDFSNWLFKKKKEMTIEDIQQQSGLNELPTTNLILLWDNLFYQLIKKESVSVRQACIQMIVASNFIKKTSNIEQVKLAALQIDLPKDHTMPTQDQKVKAYLRRLIGASVIIPKVFSVEKAKIKNYEEIYPDSYRELENQHSIFVSQYAINDLNVYKADLIQLKQVYQLDYDKEFEVQKKQHREKIQKLEGKTKTGGRKRKVPPGKLEAPDSKETSLKLTQYPDFDFTFNKALDSNYIKEKLPPKSRDFIENNKLNDSEIDSVLYTINQEARFEYQNIIKLKGQGPKVYSSNGHVVQNNQNQLHCYTLSIEKEHTGSKHEWRIFLSLNTGYKYAYISECNYQISFNKEKTFKSQKVIKASNDSKHLFMELFEEYSFNSAPKDIFIFKGVFILNNGIELKISTEGHINNKYTSGCGEVKKDIDVQTKSDMLYGVNRIGIADYRRVEQELCCYVPGEVSHIENIMAREYKERHTRNLTRSEDLTEVSTEVEIEELNDSTTSTRNDISTEVSEVLNRENGDEYGFKTGAKGKYMGVEMSADAYADFASSTAQTDSNASAQSYAQEITQRALERIVQKTTTKRSSLIIKEFEDNNRHGFDNREGDEHVTGVYRWIDTIYTNRVVNYGKRLMYEFMIPEPAHFYKKAIIKQVEEEQPIPETDVVDITPPDAPTKMDSDEPLTATDITTDNYQYYASKYNVNITPLGESPIYEPGSASPMQSPNKNEFNNPFTLIVPMNYEAVEVESNSSMDYVFGKLEHNTYFKLVVGNKTMNLDGDPPFKGNGDNLDKVKTFIFDIKPLSTSIPVNVSGKNIKNYSISFTLKCQLKQSVVEGWQVETYNAIMDAYNQQMMAYETQMLQESLDNGSEEEKEKTIKFSQQFNRTLEIRELKRIAIEMITKPFNIEIGKSFYAPAAECDTVKIPGVTQTKTLDSYASHVKFFEQAFDWEIMSYLFYAYFWAKKCKWIELFQSKNSKDQLFQNFLQSGMARMIVPVRLGFEKAVIYYMETGEIWNGSGLVLDSDDDLYLSLVEEMQTTEGTVDDEWKMTVPTTLTMLQKSSAALDEGGLPCCEELNDENVIVISDAKLIASDKENTI